MSIGIIQPCKIGYLDRFTVPWDSFLPNRTRFSVNSRHICFPIFGQRVVSLSYMYVISTIKPMCVVWIQVAHIIHYNSRSEEGCCYIFHINLGLIWGNFSKKCDI